MFKRLKKWLGFHVHDWGNWQTQGEIVIVADKRVIGFWQTRSCSCGAIEIKKVI